jgi:hypothetical protein
VEVPRRPGQKGPRRFQVFDNEQAQQLLITRAALKRAQRERGVLALRLQPGSAPLGAARRASAPPEGQERALAAVHDAIHGALRALWDVERTIAWHGVGDWKTAPLPPLTPADLNPRAAWKVHARLLQLEAENLRLRRLVEVHRRLGRGVID